MKEEELNDIEEAKKTLEASNKKEAEKEESAKKECVEKIRNILSEASFVMLPTMPLFKESPIEIGNNWFLELSQPEIILIRPKK